MIYDNAHTYDKRDKRAKKDLDLAFIPNQLHADLFVSHPMLLQRARSPTNKPTTSASPSPRSPCNLAADPGLDDIAASCEEVATTKVKDVVSTFAVVVPAPTVPTADKVPVAIPLLKKYGSQSPVQ